MELVVVTHPDKAKCVLDELTEQECDVARNRGIRHTPLQNGAFNVGTHYNSTDGEYWAEVTAEDRETARTAAKAYYNAIREELE